MSYITKKLYNNTHWTIIYLQGFGNFFIWAPKFHTDGYVTSLWIGEPF